VELEFVLCAIAFQGVEKKVRHGLGTKDRAASPGGCGYEEGADFLWGVGH
jgi:hypothetical protein